MSKNLYDVVPCSVRHIKPLASTLRPAACAALLNFGIDARRALHYAVRKSSYSRTAILAGSPVAMWGAYGTMLSDHVTVWAAFSQDAVRFPLAIVRRARSEMERMAEGGDKVYASVSRDDDRAMVFAKSIGFYETDEFETPSGMQAMAFAGMMA